MLALYAVTAINKKKNLSKKKKKKKKPTHQDKTATNNYSRCQ